MAYLRRRRGAFKTIIAEPGRLHRQPGQGGQSRASSSSPRNFLNHLQAVADPLAHRLAQRREHLHPARRSSSREIIKFVLSVLGLTWANIREQARQGRSARRRSRCSRRASTSSSRWSREGPAAAWEKIKEQLTNLQEMVIGAGHGLRQATASSRRRSRSCVTSLNPGRRLHPGDHRDLQHGHVLRRAAAADRAGRDGRSSTRSPRSPPGAIGAAANRVEQTMAGLLTLVISFLARFAGLGKVSDAVAQRSSTRSAPRSTRRSTGSSTGS